MDQGVGRNPPDVAKIKNLGVVENEPAQNAGRTESVKQTREHHQEGVERNEKSRYVHRVAADPGHRLVVIRGGDSEHAAINGAASRRARAISVCPSAADRRKFAWTTLRSGENDR